MIDDDFEETIKKELSPIHRVGVASVQGWRESMEDADLVDTGFFQVKGMEYPFSVLGIFDGHGGAEASAFLKKELKQELQDKFAEFNTENLTEVGLFLAFKKCFVELDDRYMGNDGTTATVAVLFHGAHFPLKEQIWVANVGDSRTILIDKEGKATQATEDAKPNIARYKKAIQKLGGRVLYRGVPRVNGRLAVARAIGDHSIKGKTGQCCVSPKPKITSYSLADFKGGYLVLACDGLYDVATTNEVGEAVKRMTDRGLTVEEMSNKIVESAISNGSTDNVSAIVAKLR